MGTDDSANSQPYQHLSLSLCLPTGRFYQLLIHHPHRSSISTPAMRNITELVLIELELRVVGRPDFPFSRARVDFLGPH